MTKTLSIITLNLFFVVSLFAQDDYSEAGAGPKCYRLKIEVTYYYKGKYKEWYGPTYIEIHPKGPFTKRECDNFVASFSQNGGYQDVDMTQFDRKSTKVIKPCSCASTKRIIPNYSQEELQLINNVNQQILNVQQRNLAKSNLKNQYNTSKFGSTRPSIVSNSSNADGELLEKVYDEVENRQSQQDNSPKPQSKLEEMLAKRKREQELSSVPSEHIDSDVNVKSEIKDDYSSDLSDLSALLETTEVAAKVMDNEPIEQIATSARVIVDQINTMLNLGNLTQNPDDLDAQVKVFEDVMDRVADNSGIAGVAHKQFAPPLNMWDGTLTATSRRLESILDDKETSDTEIWAPTMNYMGKVTGTGKIGDIRKAYEVERNYSWSRLTKKYGVIDGTWRKLIYRSLDSMGKR